MGVGWRRRLGGRRRRTKSQAGVKPWSVPKRTADDGSLSNSRNAYRLSSGNEPIEGLRARLTIVGGGRGAKGDKWREGATTRGGRGKKVGRGAERVN